MATFGSFSANISRSFRYDGEIKPLFVIGKCLNPKRGKMKGIWINSTHQIFNIGGSYTENVAILPMHVFFQLTASVKGYPYNKISILTLDFEKILLNNDYTGIWIFVWVKFLGTHWMYKRWIAIRKENSPAL